VVALQQERIALDLLGPIRGGGGMVMTRFCAGADKTAYG
jgi:hypothetical protein